MPDIVLGPEGPELRLFQQCPHCKADGPHIDLIFIMRCRICGKLFHKE